MLNGFYELIIILNIMVRKLPEVLFCKEFGHKKTRTKVPIFIRYSQKIGTLVLVFL